MHGALSIRGQGAHMNKNLAIFILPAVLAVFAGSPAYAQVRVMVVSSHG